MRIVITIVLLVLLPTAGFFTWAWLRAITRARKLAGTLPSWQDLPWTWLIITGLAVAIVSVLSLVLLTERPAHGWLSGRALSNPERIAGSERG